MQKRLWIGCLAAIVAALVGLRLWTGRDEPVDLDAPSCAEGPTTPGIDVSYHQSTIEWSKVRRAGIKFAFIRVSDGLTVTDPEFTRNWTNAKTAKIARGAYQFFRPEENAIAQADKLVAAIADDKGELPPVIDVEATGGLRPAQIAKQVTLWIDRVRSRLGVEPIVYTSPDFWRDEVGGADLSSQPLWVAHYTKDCPRVPAPWKRWTFWQYSKTGRVPGIKGPVDLNVYQGQMKSLGK
jgi:lysozyme